MTFMYGLSFFLLIIWMSEIYADSTERGDIKVYVTNSSSTYNNIPPTCKLYGSDFSGKLNGNISINITYEGSFWIRAGIGFKRHLNPIGAMYSCEKNYHNGITLDQCTSMCTTKYIRHNHESCHCNNSNATDLESTSLKPCDDPLCYPGGCVVYEKEVPSKRLLCGTYTYKHGDWYYETEECKTELPCICEDGHKNNRSYSWFLAHHYCQQQNSKLLRRNSYVLNDYKDGGRKYWISPLRRQVFLWQSDVIDSLCVAGNLTDDGKLIPFIEFCNRTLPALCSVQTELKHAEHTSFIGIVVAVVCVCVVILIVVVTVKKMKNNKTRGITENDILNAKDIEKPLEEKLDAVSLPELSIAYCDPKPASVQPIDTMMKVSPNPEPLYESTTNVNGAITTSNSEPVTYSDPIYTCAIKT